MGYYVNHHIEEIKEDIIRIFSLEGLSKEEMATRLLEKNFSEELVNKITDLNEKKISEISHTVKTQLHREENYLEWLRDTISRYDYEVKLGIRETKIRATKIVLDKGKTLQEAIKLLQLNDEDLEELVRCGIIEEK